MADLQEFRKRLDGLRGRIVRARQTGAFSEHEAWLAQDALFAWSSGESSHTWVSRSAVTADLIEKLKREEIWPWEAASGK